MPFDCDHRRTFGPDVCPAACHAVGRGVFAYVRADKAGDLPVAEPGCLDVFVLDMNHGWPNIGHDAVVMAVRTAACDMAEAIAAAGLRVRVVSCDVRRGFVVPPLPDRRGGLYLGTGGPGHIDPRQNDGGDGSQGIVESPAWESPLFALFDAVHAHPDAALIGICHTFGVMSRWLGVADPVLRGPEKGGKSVGIVDNRADAGVRRSSLVQRARARRRRRAGPRRARPRPRQPALRSAAAPVAWPRRSRRSASRRRRRTAPPARP